MDKGTKIRILREAQGLTQYQLGTICGTTKQTIFKYENGIITNIPTIRLEKIATALHTTPGYLMGWSDSNDLEVVEVKKLDPLIEAACASLKELKPEYQKYISDQITQLLSIQRKEQEP